MEPTHCRGMRVGRRVGVFVAVLMASAVAAHSSTLFPQPLHLVRSVTDPISHATTTVNEYCLGNRIVSANRDRSVIVDYDKQTITEIDRRAGTYSISSFDDVARATAALRPATKAGERAGGGWKQTELGPRASVAGRTAAAWQFTNAAGTKIEVAVDRQIVLSKEALDALIGASYPNRRTEEHEALTRAASGGAGRAQTESTQPHVASFALPLDETITWEVEESRLTLRNAVTAVTTEVAPPEVLTIPPGAKRVESSRVALPRLLEELDKVPNAPSRP